MVCESKDKILKMVRLHHELDAPEDEYKRFALDDVLLA